MDQDRFDVETELRAGRARPRAEFASALAGHVREARGRARQGRVGMTLALAGLVVVAVASFGGIGTAASSRGVKASEPAKTAAGAQYTQPKAPFAPPKAKPAKVPTSHVQAATKTKAPTTVGQTQSANAAPVKSGQLPFTGLALWVPLAAGLALIALGLTLRLRSRRHGSTA